MEQQFKEKLAISIVTFHAEEYVRNLLKALRWVNNEENVKIYISDNTEGHSVKDIVGGSATSCEYYHSPTNVGFGTGHNKNFGDAASWMPQYFLLLNPDMEIEREVIVGLLDEIKKPNNQKVAIIGPKLINNQGKIEDSILKDPSALSLGFMLFMEMLGFKRKVVLPPQTTQSVFGVSGACMLIRNDALRSIGGFDDEYFMYHEDNDLCKRAHAAGWDILYTPTLTVKHFLGKSSDAYSDKTHWLKKRMLVSYLIYFSKHKGRLQTMLLKCIWLINLKLRIIFNKDREWARDVYPSIAKFGIT